MPRFHNVDGVRIQFTPADEAQRDAEEAAWARAPTPGERAARATAAADVDMGTPLMRALADTLLSDPAVAVSFRTALEARHDERVVAATPR